MPTMPRTGNADRDRADATLDAYSALRVDIARLALDLQGDARYPPECVGCGAHLRIAYMLRVVLEDHR